MFAHGFIVNGYTVFYVDWIWHHELDTQPYGLSQRKRQQAAVYAYMGYNFAHYLHCIMVYLAWSIYGNDGRDLIEETGGTWTTLSFGMIYSSTANAVPLSHP